MTQQIIGVPISRIAATGLCLLIASAAGAQTFTGLGRLSDGMFSRANAVNSDGSAVAGTLDDGFLHEQAFRWTRADGLEPLGTWPDVSLSGAAGISGDGSIVVGHASIEFNHTRAFRWTRSEGIVSLGALTGGSVSSAHGISEDGSVIVGESTSAFGLHAMRWTAEGGMRDMGTLPGGMQSYFRAVSADGSVAVGYSHSPQGNHAVRAVGGGSLQSLGVMPGGEYSEAYGVSRGGSVIVGYGDLSHDTGGAFRWSGGGLMHMPTPAWGISGLAHGVSGDGTHIVGYVVPADGQIRAFLWNQISGMVDLNAYLPSLGIDLSDWTLSAATAISPDGNHIVGYGDHNGLMEAWILDLVGCFALTGDHSAVACVGGEATLNVFPVGAEAISYQWRFRGAEINAAANPSAATGTLVLAAVTAADAGVYDCVVTGRCGVVISAPATLTVCVGDYNCDGGIDGADVDAFFSDWESGNAAADVNSDGGVDGADVAEFFTRWEAGC